MVINFYRFGFIYIILDAPVELVLLYGFGFMDRWFSYPFVKVGVGSPSLGLSPIICPYHIDICSHSFRSGGCLDFHSKPICSVMGYIWLNLFYFSWLVLLWLHLVVLALSCLFCFIIFWALISLYFINEKSHFLFLF